MNINKKDSNKISLIEFMNERRNVDRWFVLKVGISGAFCGSLLTAAFLVTGLG